MGVDLDMSDEEVVEELDRWGNGILNSLVLMDSD